MRFTSLLSHLSASTTSQLKAAHYALKHRDMDEDLHSCILENLEGEHHNMNNRANVMYFLEQHVDLNLEKETQGGHPAYVDMVRRDIERIVRAVVGAGGANVKVARKVLGGLRERGVLSVESVMGMEAGLKGSEGQDGQAGGTEEYDVASAGVIEGGLAPMEGLVGSEKITPRREKEMNVRPKKEISEREKRAIEQRIEEDRERNKRLREGVWAVSGDDDEELEKMWDEGSDLGEDDYVIAQEEAEERLQFARYHRTTFEAT